MKRIKTITLAQTPTGRELQKRGYMVLANKAENGTITEAEALRQAHALDSITGKDIKSAYALTYGIKCGLIALHTIENYSGGQEYIRELAEQAERIEAIQNSTEAENHHELFASVVGQTMPDCMDTLQESMCAIAEHGIMVGTESTVTPTRLSTGAKLDDNDKPVYTTGKEGKKTLVRADVCRVVTYANSHEKAVLQARRFSDRQAKRKAKQIEPKDNSRADIIADDKNKLMYVITGKEDSYTVQIEDRTALDLIYSACLTQWDRDVITALLSVELTDKTAMPTTPQIAEYMQSHKEQYTEAVQRELSKSDRTVRGRINKTFDNLSHSPKADEIRAELLEALYDKRDKKAMRIHA